MGHECRRTALDSLTGDRVCLDCGATQGVAGKRRKYGNVPTEYGGVRYDSRLEADYARQLDLRLRAGEIRAWRRQVPVPLEVNGRLVTTYRVDFEVIHMDNTLELVETKGRETADWKIKRNLLLAVHADDLATGKMRYTVVK